MRSITKEGIINLHYLEAYSKVICNPKNAYELEYCKANKNTPDHITWRSLRSKIIYSADRLALRDDELTREGREALLNRDNGNVTIYENGNLIKYYSFVFADLFKIKDDEKG